MSRCDICKHDACVGEWRCISKQCELFNIDEHGCNCVLCDFDINEDCPLYKPKEVTNDTGSKN